MKKNLITLFLFLLISLPTVGQELTHIDTYTVEKTEVISENKVFKKLFIQKGTLTILEGVHIIIEEHFEMNANALLNIKEGGSIQVLDTHNDAFILKGNSTIQNDGYLEILGSIYFQDFGFYRGKGHLEIKRNLKVTDLAEMTIEGEVSAHQLYLSNDFNHKISITPKGKLLIRSKMHLTANSSLEVSGQLIGKGNLEAYGKAEIHIKETGRMLLTKNAYFAKSSIAEVSGKLKIEQDLIMHGHCSFVVYGSTQVNKHLHQYNKSVLDIAQKGNLEVKKNFNLHQHSEVYVDGLLSVWGMIISSIKHAKNISTSEEGIIKVSTQNTLRLEGANTIIEKDPS